MDVNALRSITTVFMLVVFLGIVVWAWNGRRRAEFAEAERLPFLDSTPAAALHADKSGEKR